MSLLVAMCLASWGRHRRQGTRAGGATAGDSDCPSLRSDFAHHVLIVEPQ